MLKLSAHSIISAAKLFFVLFIMDTSERIVAFTSVKDISDLDCLLFQIVSNASERNQIAGSRRFSSRLMFRVVMLVLVSSPSSTLGSISIKTAITHSLTTLSWSESRRF